MGVDLELLGPLTLIFTCLDESDVEEVEELELKLRLKLQPKAPTGPRERFPCCPPPSPDPLVGTCRAPFTGRPNSLRGGPLTAQVDRIPSGGNSDEGRRLCDKDHHGVLQTLCSTKFPPACCKPFVPPRRVANPFSSLFDSAHDSAHGATEFPPA